MVDDESDVNSFRLVGNIGLLRPAATPRGRALLNFTVATHYAVWDANAGKRKEQTEWHDVVAFDKLAERMQEQLTKGTRAEVVGYVRKRSWEDKDNGTKHWRCELVAQDFKVIKRGLSVPDELETREAGGHTEDARRRADGREPMRLF